MATEQAPAAEAGYSWLGVRWPEWARLLLIVQCIFAGAVQLLVGLADALDYAVDIPGALTVLYWVVAGAAGGVAAVAMATRRPWFAPVLLVAEVAILLSSCYVLWADLTSPYADWAMRWPAILALVVAVFVIPPLTAKLIELPGKAWGAAVAVLSALGGTQFLVENFVVPNRSAPVVEISATLAEAGRSGTVTHVRGVITWKNVGHASAWIPQAFASVTATGDGPGRESPLAAPTVMKTFDPLQLDGQEFSRQLPASVHSGVVWLDDLVPFRSTLPPGVTEHREFLLEVPRTRVRSLELRVHLTALTNAQAERATTCDQKTSSLADDFLERYRRPTVNGGFTSACLEVPLPSRSIIRSLTDDEPTVVMGYAFIAPQPEYLGPFVYYSSVEDNLADAAALQRAGDRFDRLHPSLVLTESAVLALPLDPATGSAAPKEATTGP